MALWQVAFWPVAYWTVALWGSGLMTQWPYGSVALCIGGLMGWWLFGVVAFGQWPFGRSPRLLHAPISPQVMTACWYQAWYVSQIHVNTYQCTKLSSPCTKNALRILMIRSLSHTTSWSRNHCLSSLACTFSATCMFPSILCAKWAQDRHREPVPG